MSTIIVSYAWCPEHGERHMVDEQERHVANDTDELTDRGFFYVRHIGGGWFSYREPYEPQTEALDAYLEARYEEALVAAQDDQDW